MKASRQEHPLDCFGHFESVKKINNKINFGMWALFYVRNIALKYFFAGLLFVFEK